MTREHWRTKLRRGKSAAIKPPLNGHAHRFAGGNRRVSPSPRLGAMRTFRPPFPTQMTQVTGQCPNCAAAANLVVSPPRIDARANLMEGYLRRFCRRRNLVRQCLRVILADSPLKTELPGVLKGLNFGAHAGRPVLIYANWSIIVQTPESVTCCYAY